jgi:hypothetical protein
LGARATRENSRNAHDIPVWTVRSGQAMGFGANIAGNLHLVHTKAHTGSSARVVGVASLVSLASIDSRASLLHDCRACGNDVNSDMVGRGGRHGNHSLVGTVAQPILDILPWAATALLFSSLLQLRKRLGFRRGFRRRGRV